MSEHSEYLELQSVVKNGAIITEVEEKKNSIFFRIDGYLFRTYGHNAYHEKHPLFDHFISDLWAEQANTPEGIQEAQERDENTNREFELFMKHRSTLIKLVVLRAVELLVEEGEEAFFKYLDYHFDIMENGNHCQRLLNLIEKKEI
jgi:hypothetical protein